jgi:aryl carrier-like protein
MTSKASTVFFFTRLADPDRRDEYEKWVREVDTPTALALAGVDSYRVVRLTEDILGERPDMDYVEIIECSDVDAYLAAIQTVDPEFMAQFASFIGKFQSVGGNAIN